MCGFVRQIEDDPNDVAGPSPVIIQLNSMNGAAQQHGVCCIVADLALALTQLWHAVLAGTHANVEGVVRDYLAREWAARRKQPLERGLELFGPSGALSHDGVLSCLASHLSDLTY